ncbi:MAG TPA: TIR domain-containing protein [Opitutus sp.]|nr:TIR domain-containing protein [Opitutus sp.]
MGASDKAVFLSYAREDAEAARRIAGALRGFGVEVWFDQNELRGGDAWDQQIRGQIKACALFVPVISATTQARDEAYFRLEWKLADDRTHLMAPGKAFILPVVIDDTPETVAAVPDSFGKAQWMRLPNGLPTPQFVERVSYLLQSPGKPAAESTLAASSRAAAPASASGKKSGPPGWVWAAATALAFVVAGGGAYLVLHKSPAPVRPVASSAVAAAPAAAPVVDSKSIAVLPLENMSEDKDTGFFADGVHEDLLTNLALVPELKVTSRTSVMQYRGTTKSIREIARELGVAYVLEGSVRRSGNKVRVTGQLIDTRTDEHVWAKAYDRDLTDIFSIQAELSREIAGALSAAISPETQKLLDRRPTENPVAYDDFLKGRDLRNNSPASSLPALNQAEAYFKSAVQQDPKFAAAWGELAIVHALHSFWGSDGSAARLAEADAAIGQAVRLAPDDPAVIESLGTYAYYAYRDYARATEQYEKLARLRPNDATVFSSLGLIQRRQGRWAESLGNLRRAVELDPGNVGYVRNIKDSLLHARRWDDLRAAHERLIALAPDKLRERLDAATDEFSATGSLQAADDLFARLTPAEREAPITIYFRKFWAIDRGDFAEFKRLDRLQPTLAEEEQPELAAIIAGAVYFATGDVAGLKARIAQPLADVQGRVKREPGNAIAWAFLADMEALAGNKDEARRIAQRAVEMMPESRDALDGPIFRFVAGWVAAVTGDKDGAIEEIRHLLGTVTPFSAADIRSNPAFLSLRGDARFEAMMNDPKNNQPLF